MLLKSKNQHRILCQNQRRKLLTQFPNKTNHRLLQSYLQNRKKVRRKSLSLSKISQKLFHSKLIKLITQRISMIRVYSLLELVASQHLLQSIWKDKSQLLLNQLRNLHLINQHLGSLHQCPTSKNPKNIRIWLNRASKGISAGMVLIPILNLVTNSNNLKIWFG